MIDISNVRSCDVLAALYNFSKPLGYGHLQYEEGDMTPEEAQRLLDMKRSTYFDYLKGRVMKVDVAGPELDPRLYDRDNGPGAAQKALVSLVPKKPRTAWERMAEDV